MKLPLITRIKDSKKSPKRRTIFHILKLEGDTATGVDEKELKLRRIKFEDLEVLSEPEHQEWKKDNAENNRAANYSKTQSTDDN